MLRSCLMGIAAATVSVALSGCGNPPGHFPVSGKVLYKGEPAAGAVVYFHRQGGHAAAGQTIPTGIADDDGTFSLECDGIGSGCPAGNYAVLVEWKDPTGDGVVPVKTKGKTKLVKRSRVRVGPDRLKGRYFDLGKPMLNAEVKPESNRLAPFELTD
jgi:hypothetical protein